MREKPSPDQIRKSLHRPAASTTWSFDHRWGPQFGDNIELSVTRTANGPLRIAYGNAAVEVRAELVDVLATMIAAAAAWTDGESTVVRVES